MNYEAAEDSIIVLLQPLTIGGNVQLMPMPENDSELKSILQKSQIYVQYSGGDFNFPTSTGAGVQECKVDFEIIFRARTRRGPIGCYALMLATKNLLIGQRPNKNIFQAMLYLTNESYVAKDDRGEWIYRQIYSSKSIALQLDSNEADVILTQINTADNITVTTGIDLPINY